MHVADVIDAHMKWKISLQEYLDGTWEHGIDPALLQHADQSAVGKWIRLHGTGQLSHYGAFFTVRAKHAQCQLVAGEVVEQVLAGNRAGAQNLMKERLLKSSHELVYALIDLERQQGRS